jgi:cysteine desulfurase
MRIYLDHNATTPPSDAVISRMASTLRDEFGNPSSVHHFGQRAKAVIDEARSAVAGLIGADPGDVVFTGGGTEGDNLAIRGAAEALEPSGKKHLIASAIEHEAVLNTFKALARRGWKTTLLPVDESGIVSPDALRAAITDDTALVSVMHANNEIGTVQPIAVLSAIARERRALFHTDAVQSAGKITIDVKALGVDLLSISAHKFYGPKGVGALWIRRGVRLQTPLTGGKQERSRRAGTENVAGIVGMGVAAREAIAKWNPRRRDWPRFAIASRMACFGG